MAFLDLFRKKVEINWNENGVTVVRENDPEKHLLGISCITENGQVVEVRTRHSHGEEVKGEVTCDGKNILPISTTEFTALYNKGKLEFK